jgi:actin-related protein
MDLFEKICDHTLITNLLIKPKENPILFSEPPIHNKDQRLKLTEFMFEKYNIPAMFLCKSAVLSAFSCARSTGLIVDSGHSNTYVIPVHDGYAL